MFEFTLLIFNLLIFKHLRFPPSEGGAGGRKIFDVHIDEIKTMKALVKHAMENPVNMIVPMEVEMELAGNWLEVN